MRFYMAVRMEDKTALSMRRALGGLPAGLRRTVTYDNGLENALHEVTNRELVMKSYFCKLCHSWEKGSVENQNGMLRRYFPKGHDWRLTTQKELDRVVRRINATPMKRLGYKTPAEVFAKYAGVALVS
jgi:IS30 family transposase